jgi:hypothetical protein
MTLLRRNNHSEWTDPRGAYNIQEERFAAFRGGGGMCYREFYCLDIFGESFLMQWPRAPCGSPVLFVSSLLNSGARMSAKGQPS